MPAKKRRVRTGNSRCGQGPRTWKISSVGSPGRCDACLAISPQPWRNRPAFPGLEHGTPRCRLPPKTCTWPSGVLSRGCHAAATSAATSAAAAPSAATAAAACFPAACGRGCRCSAAGRPSNCNSSELAMTARLLKPIIAPAWQGVCGECGSVRRGVTSGTSVPGSRCTPGTPAARTHGC
mgnify:CR=1 FL=1